MPWTTLELLLTVAFDGHNVVLEDAVPRSFFFRLLFEIFSLSMESAVRSEPSTTCRFSDAIADDEAKEYFFSFWTKARSISFCSGCERDPRWVSSCSILLVFSLCRPTPSTSQRHHPPSSVFRPLLSTFSLFITDASIFRCAREAVLALSEVILFGSAVGHVALRLDALESAAERVEFICCGM